MSFSVCPVHPVMALIWRKAPDIPSRQNVGMPVKTTDPITLRHWLDQGRAMLVDVREPAEYRALHIPEAYPIPLGQIEAARLPASPGAVVVHCLKGGRGAMACEKLLRQNPQLDVYNLAGGIDAWAAAGLPVRTGVNFALPLDRQVQLAVGCSLLAASVLTFFVHPLFVLVTAALGAGLTIAGLTGFCGLAKVLARAPWNH
jgi:rhodanese-related sulfurtransferase